MRSLAWRLAAIAAFLAGIVWVAVVFSALAAFFTAMFGIVMCIVYRWRFGGELGYFGRKEERWEAAPSWSPPGGTKLRVAPRWVVVTAIVLLIAAVGFAGYLVLKPEQKHPKKFTAPTATDQR